jgi:hypothetical protein
VATHEEQFLAVLEKIGQSEVSASTPSVLDADGDSSAEHVETAGPSEDPNQEAADEDLVAANAERPGLPEDALAPITKRNLWVHHDTHPVVYDVALLSEYGTDWFEWEAETLWREIREDFRVPSISDHARSKIQAVKTLHIHEWYWTKWEVFCWITQALNNNIPDFRVLQKPSPAQLMNSVDVATMVRNDQEFTAELQMFVAAVMVEGGIFYAPQPIRFCQDEIETLLDELKVGKELIGQVQERWRAVKLIAPEVWVSSPEPILQEDVVDIQVAKLKVACDYLDLRRRQLQDQLRLLK